MIAESQRTNGGRRMIVVLACITALFYALAGCGGLKSQVDASNRVVIIIDGSGSYRSRQASAITKTVRLLSEIAETKVHLWEAGQDSITVISLDAMPDVIWHGSLQDLKAADSASWAARFNSRADYACCTDVGAAFRLAASRFGGDPRYVKKFLFVFTDGINEPPTTSLCRCRSAASPSSPPAGFPWEGLEDVAVAMFWMPAEQKLAWRHAADTSGEGGTFAIYTDSESDVVSMSAPPRPQVVVSESEREAAGTKIVHLGLGILKWGLLVFFSAMTLVLCLAALARRRPPGGHHP